MNGLPNGDKIEVCSWGNQPFQQPVHYNQYYFRNSLIQLLATDIGREHLLKTISQYRRHLTVAGPAIPGSFKVVCLAKNKRIKLRRVYRQKLGVGAGWREKLSFIGIPTSSRKMVNCDWKSDLQIHRFPVLKDSSAASTIRRLLMASSM